MKPEREKQMPYDITYIWGFPTGAVVKNPPASEGDAGDVGSILRLGGSPGMGNGTPLQYFCPEKSHGQRSLAAYSPWSHKESDTNEQLKTHTHTHTYTHTHKHTHIYICVCVFFYQITDIYVCMYLHVCSVMPDSL